TAVTLTDMLPAGFAYKRGTARLDGTRIADPTGGAGPKLEFAIGAIDNNATATLTYRVRVGPGAFQGTGINSAQATSAGPPAVASNIARVKVRLQQGVFTDRAVVIGKVFVD